jgi:hypothetical protein
VGNLEGSGINDDILERSGINDDILPPVKAGNMSSFMPDPSKFPTLSQFMDKLLKQMSNGYYNLGQGFLGSFIKTPKGNILYAWQPNSGSAYIYKWDTASNTWQLVSSITNLVKGAEEPKSIYGLKYITWQETGGSITTVTDNGLTLKLNGPSAIETYKEASYTVYVAGGTLPYSYQWSSDSLQTSNGNTANYKWKTPGTKVVSVSVTDSNGNTATVQMNVNVIENWDIELFGPDTVAYAYGYDAIRLYDLRDVWAYTVDATGPSWYPITLKDRLRVIGGIVMVQNPDIRSNVTNFNPYDLNSVRNAFPNSFIVKFNRPGNYRANMFPDDLYSRFKDYCAVPYESLFVVNNNGSYQLSGTITIPDDVSSSRPYYVPIFINVNSIHIIYGSDANLWKRMWDLGIPVLGSTNIKVIIVNAYTDTAKAASKPVTGYYAQPPIFQIRLDVQYYLQETNTINKYLVVTYDKSGKLVYTWADGGNRVYPTADLFWKGYNNGDPIKSSVDSFLNTASNTVGQYPAFDMSQILNLTQPITFDWKNLVTHQVAVAVAPIYSVTKETIYDYKPVSQTNTQTTNYGLVKETWLLRSYYPSFKDGIAWTSGGDLIRLDDNFAKIISSPFSEIVGGKRVDQVPDLNKTYTYPLYYYDGSTLSVSVKPQVRLNGSFTGSIITSYRTDSGITRTYIFPDQTISLENTSNPYTATLPQSNATTSLFPQELTDVYYPSGGYITDAFLTYYASPFFQVGKIALPNPLHYVLVQPSYSITFDNPNPINIIAQKVIHPGGYYDADGFRWDGSTATGYNSIAGVESGVVLDIAQNNKAIALFTREGSYATIYPLSKGHGVCTFVDPAYNPKDFGEVILGVTVNVDVGNFSVKVNGQDWYNLPNSSWQSWSRLPTTFINSITNFTQGQLTYIVQDDQGRTLQNQVYNYTYPNIPINQIYVIMLNVSITTAGNVKVRFRVWGDNFPMKVVDGSANLTNVIDDWLKNIMINEASKSISSSTIYKSLNYAIDLSPDGGTTWFTIKSRQDVVKIVTNKK